MKPADYTKKTYKEFLEKIKSNDFVSAESMGFELLSNNSKLGKDEQINLFTELSKLYFIRNEFKKSLDLLQNALELSPNNPSLISNLASIYQNTGRYHEAIDLFQKALELSPNDATIYSNLATVYREMNQYENSKELLEKAFELSPDDSTILSNLGAIYLDIGDINKAEELFLKALNNAPNNPKIYSNLGAISRLTKNYENAESYLNKSLSIQLTSETKNNSDLAKTMSNLAALYIDLKKYDKAVKLLENSIRLGGSHGIDNPSKLYSIVNLAVLYFNMNDILKSKTLIDYALKEMKKLFGEEHPSTKEIQKIYDEIKTIENKV